MTMILATPRVLVRGLLLIAVTLASAGTIFLSLAFRRLAPRRQLVVRNAAFRFWARSFARIVGMRVEVTGTPPQGPFFLVANHTSYMDIMLLASYVDAAFVAKADLRSWPALGAIFGVADTIFIDRGRRRDVLRVMELVAGKLGRGLGVVVFPEGTSSSGDEVLPFKPSLLEFAAANDYPVHYAALRYVTRGGHPPARDAVCWWGDATFFPHVVRLLSMPGFDARLAFGEVPLHDPDRKALGQKLRSAIGERFAAIR